MCHCPGWEKGFRDIFVPSAQGSADLFLTQVFNKAKSHMQNLLCTDDFSCTTYHICHVQLPKKQSSGGKKGGADWTCLLLTSKMFSERSLWSKQLPVVKTTISLFAISLFMLKWYLTKLCNRRKAARQELGSYAQISIFIAWNPAGSSTECQSLRWLTETNMHLACTLQQTPYCMTLDWLKSACLS